MACIHCVLTIEKLLSCNQLNRYLLSDRAVLVEVDIHVNSTPTDVVWSTEEPSRVHEKRPRILRPR